MAASNPEIHNAFKLLCNGANPQSLMQRPIDITVQVLRDGSTRVTCPYLQGVITSRDDKSDPVWFCQVSTGSYINLNSVVANISETTLHPDGYKKLRETFSLCVHKYPV